MANKQVNDTPLLIGVRKLCSALDIGKTAFFAHRSAGRIPLREVRIGNKLLFRFAEVEAWVLNGCPDVNSWNWEPEPQNAIDEQAQAKAQGQESRKIHPATNLQGETNKY